MFEKFAYLLTLLLVKKKFVYFNFYLILIELYHFIIFD